MSLARLINGSVITLVLLGAIAMACALMSSNLSWTRGWVGIVWFFALAAGVLGGLFGGISLAIARRNPLWLLATVAAFCMSYVGLVFMYGIGIASLH